MGTWMWVDVLIEEQFGCLGFVAVWRILMWRVDGVPKVGIFGSISTVGIGLGFLVFQKYLNGLLSIISKHITFDVVMLIKSSCALYISAFVDLVVSVARLLDPNDPCIL